MFVKEYLVDKNATRAAAAAGYSKRTATQIGHENLSKPYILEAIESGLKQQEEKVEKRLEAVTCTKERWLEEVTALAMSDITELYSMSPDGKFTMSLAEIKSRGLGRLIRKMHVNTKTGMATFELYNKQPSMELLGKANKWVSDQIILPQVGEPISEAQFQQIFQDPNAASLVLKVAKLTSKPAKGDKKQ